MHAPVQPTPVTQCADCGAPVSGKYCAACGQETLIETPTVRHFLHEFADQYVALEGKLGRTLRVLILQPGQLTLDYVEGRRQRYVRPLKLYLTISVVFFTLLGLLPDARNPFVNEVTERDGKPVVIHYDGKSAPKPATEPAAGPAPADAVPAIPAPGPGTAPPAPTRKEADDDDDDPDSFSGAVKRKAEDFSKLSPEQQQRTLRKKLADDAPYAMFFLLPYFALLLHWFNRRQKLRYGVHLLFSLHLHSFLFILLAIGFIPLPSFLSWTLKAGIGVYVFLALRRVYGGTPMRTLWRMAWLWVFYLIAVTATAVSGVMTALLSSGASS